MKCYVNLVICILYPLFIWPYSSHRITMQCFTCIYIDINIKYVSIGHIIHFLRSKYGPKTMKILWFLPIQYSLSNRITPPVSILLCLKLLQQTTVQHNKVPKKNTPTETYRKSLLKTYY